MRGKEILKIILIIEQGQEEKNKKSGLFDERKYKRKQTKMGV